MPEARISGRPDLRRSRAEDGSKSVELIKVLQMGASYGYISSIEVAFVTACTALLSAFVAPFITLRMARAQIRATVVSSNRQRWIETLRDLIAAFCAQVIAAAPVRAQILGEAGILQTTDPELLTKIEEIVRTFTKIRLLINPSEADHRALIDILMRIVATLRTAPLDTTIGTSIDEHIETVVTVSQVILKREWARVKTGQ